ncbi:MAG: hypothetical protein AAGD06_17840, partial [Acidobacteriota bacterium]
MLKKLKIWQKLALIAAAFGLAVPAVLYLVLSDRLEARDATLKRAEGLEYIRVVFPVFLKVPQHRGQTNALLGGDLSQVAVLDELDPQIDADLDTLSTFDSLLGNRFGTTEDLA